MVPLRSSRYVRVLDLYFVVLLRRALFYGALWHMVFGFVQSHVPYFDIPWIGHLGRQHPRLQRHDDSGNGIPKYAGHVFSVQQSPRPIERLHRRPAVRRDQACRQRVESRWRRSLTTNVARDEIRLGLNCVRTIYMYCAWLYSSRLMIGEYLLFNLFQANDLGRERSA